MSRFYSDELKSFGRKDEMGPMGHYRNELEDFSGFLGGFPNVSNPFCGASTFKELASEDFVKVLAVHCSRGQRSHEVPEIRKERAFFFQEEVDCFEMDWQKLRKEDQKPLQNRNGASMEIRNLNESLSSLGFVEFFEILKVAKGRKPSKARVARKDFFPFQFFAPTLLWLFSPIFNSGFFIKPP